MIIIRNKLFSNDLNIDNSVSRPKDYLIAGGAATGATVLGKRLIGYNKSKNRIKNVSSVMKNDITDNAIKDINSAKLISDGTIQGYNNLYKKSGRFGKRKILNEAKKLRINKNSFIDEVVDSANRGVENVSKSEAKALNRAKWISRANAGKLALVGGAVTLGAAGISKLINNKKEQNTPVNQTNLTAQLYNLPVNNSIPIHQKVSDNSKYNIIVR